MQVDPEKPDAPLIERRRADRRHEDLDGAYNDGAKTPPLEVAKGVLLYVVMLWIGATALIGSYVVLKWLLTAIRRW